MSTKPPLPPRSRGVQIGLRPNLPSRPSAVALQGGPTLPVRPLSSTAVFQPQLPTRNNVPSLPSRTNAISAATEAKLKSLSRRVPSKYERRDFDVVDTYVRNLPSYADTKELAYALTCNFPDPVDKARAIYDWIAFNIAYDANSYLKGRVPPQSAQSTFQNRTAVCAGYSRLFQELADFTGIQCVSIAGFGKGFGFDPLVPQVSGCNHEWNAVYIENEWRMVESTWGAGYIDTSFHFQFNPKYFLVNPDEFIYQHMPMNEDHQYTTYRYTWEQFFALNSLTPDFWSSGVALQNYINCGSLVQATQGEEISITLSVPKRMYLHASLTSKAGDKTGPSLCLRSRAGPDRYDVEVRCRIPHFESGDIRLFHKSVDDTDSQSLSPLLSYAIAIKKPVVGQPPAVLAFPTVWSSMASLECSLVSPLSTPLQARTFQKFIVEDLSADATAKRLALYLWLDNQPGPQMHRTVNGLEIRYSARHEIINVTKIQVAQKNGNSYSFLATWDII